jgi:tetratricopeptide (TPR) repeat protein
VPDVNRVDALADALHRAGRSDEVERVLERLDPSTLSPAELQSWWHAYGVAALQAGREDEALERFQEGYARFPGSAHIRFSLGQQYVRAHEVDRGFALFRTCAFPDVPSAYVLAQARYAYLWDRHADGMSFIRPFFATYRELGILDDHFLFVRGLPFFGRWWAYLAAFAILAGELGELESVTRFVVAHCRDYDFAYLQLELAAHRDDAPALLLEALDARLGTMSAGDFPSGSVRMQIAIIRARTVATVDAARALLAGVTLSEGDASWLEDVRTLALAEAAQRLGDPVLERACVDAFLARQPMLFEPDIALGFHLLRYQERLKPRARAQGLTATR